MMYHLRSHILPWSKQNLTTVLSTARYIGQVHASWLKKLGTFRAHIRHVIATAPVASDPAYISEQFGIGLSLIKIGPSVWTTEGKFVGGIGGTFTPIPHPPFSINVV